MRLQSCRVELQEGSLGLQNLLPPWLTQMAVLSIELLECPCNRAIAFYHTSDPPAVARPGSMLPFLSGLLYSFVRVCPVFPTPCIEKTIEEDWALYFLNALLVILIFIT